LPCSQTPKTPRDGSGRPIAPERLQAAGVREVLKKPQKPLLSATIADVLARHLAQRPQPADESRQFQASRATAEFQI